MNKALAELLREFPPGVIEELRVTSARLKPSERERLQTQAYRRCPNLWAKDDWSEFDALPAEVRAKVETGIGLTVLETIDNINQFLGMCKRGD
jgi:hypothetical protein